MSLYRIFVHIALGSFLITFGAFFARPLTELFYSPERHTGTIAIQESLETRDAKTPKEPTSKVGDNERFDDPSSPNHDTEPLPPDHDPARPKSSSSVAEQSEELNDQPETTDNDDSAETPDTNLEDDASAIETMNYDYNVQHQQQQLPQSRQRVPRNASTWQQPNELGDLVNLNERTVKITGEALPLTREHQRRLALVADKCSTQQTTDSVTPDDYGSNIFVNDELRFVYCLVPKVACTTWTRVLLVAAGAFDKLPNELPQSVVTAERLRGSVLKRLSDFSPADIEYRLKYYFKFMFVRHPLERLVSAFRDRLQSNHKIARNIIGKKIIQRYRQPNPDLRKRNRRAKKPKRNNVPTFEEFVQYLVDPVTAQEGPFNLHWRPQADLCRPCSIMEYDFIGHFETLSEDADFVLRSILGQSASSVVEFPKFDPDNFGGGRRQHSSSLVSKMFSEIPADRLRKLKEIYRMDYELFGYESEPSFNT